MAEEEGKKEGREDQERLSQRLRELRVEKGLTQAELADKAGVSERSITQWERGVREPSWSNVLAMCRALGVDCLAFTQEPTTPSKPRPGRPKKATPSQADQESTAENGDDGDDATEEKPKRKGK